MSRHRSPADPATLLIRALNLAIVQARLPLEIVADTEAPWSSATFTGTTHAVTLSGQRDAAVDRWLAALPDAEWFIRGQLVADCTVERTAERTDERHPAGAITLAFLLIADG